MRSRSFVAALAVLSLFLTGQTSTWPASKITPECSEATFAQYGLAFAAPSFFCWFCYEWIVVSGVPEMQYQTDWAEDYDKTGEWSAPSSTVPIMVFTRAGATGVKFEFDCILGSQITSIAGAGAYTYHRVYQDDDNEMVPAGGDATDSELLATAWHQYDGSYLHVIPIRGVATLDSGDRIGLIAQPGNSSSMYVRSLTCHVREIGECL